MTEQEEQVVLVDTNDMEIGTAGKMHAHEAGLLHRAISVMVARKKNGQWDLLLQQRAQHKYHSAGLWTNTACTHPRAGETTQSAAARRLQEEMGVQCPLHLCGSFIYRETLDNGLIEHEFDHVFLGLANSDEFTPNPNEAAAGRWLSLGELQQELAQTPHAFTAWFAQVLSLCITQFAMLDKNSKE